MTQNPAWEARRLYRTPLEPRKRLRFLVVRGFWGVILFYFIVGWPVSFLAARSLYSWKVGLLCILISMGTAVSFRFWEPKLRRATTFYAAIALVSSPLWLLWFSGGASMLALLAPDTLLMMYAGILLGVAMLPALIARRRSGLVQSIERGHLHRSLDRGRATWDPAFDMDHILKDPAAMRPGILWRLAYWIGPAIGMSLSSIIGRPSAAFVVGSLFILMGYGNLMGLIVNSGAHVLELLGQERELGRRIHLAEASQGS